MSSANKKRLSAKVKQRDIVVLEALKGIGSYNPSNPAYKTDALSAMKEDMDKKQETEVQAKADVKSKRDDCVESEKAFHNALLAAIDMVRAQFGEDSNEYQELGRTKKSEHKSPKRKPKNEPAKP